MARGDDMRLTMVMVCADPCLAHAHAHVRDAGRYDTTVGAAGDGGYGAFIIFWFQFKRNRVCMHIYLVEVSCALCSKSK